MKQWHPFSGAPAAAVTLELLDPGLCAGRRRGQRPLNKTSASSSLVTATWAQRASHLYLSTTLHAPKRKPLALTETT